MSDLADLDATATAELIRAGEITPLEATEAAIARIEERNAELNAVIHPLFEKATETAASPDLPDGPFRGVPMALKDLTVGSAGDPLHEGMRFLRDLEWRAQHDGHVVARLRAAGFVFVGRTNTPELGLLPTTEPEAYGPTRNPWDTARSPGGSSGGSAAAVASRMVPLAHGSDGGGSIRIPSSACGLVGLKPSRGRVSPGPDHGEVAVGFAVEHVLTRTVRDSAAVLDVLAGYESGDPYTAPAPRGPFVRSVAADPGPLRIGALLRAPGQIVGVASEAVDAVMAAASALEAFGHDVSETHPAALDAPEYLLHFGVVGSADTAAYLDRWTVTTGTPITADDVEANTWTFAELGRTQTGAQVLTSREWLFAFARRVAAWWDGGFDLLLTPTLAMLPPALGSFEPTPENPFAASEPALALTPFTPPFNATGQPAISLPVAQSRTGVPVGVQLVARYGNEELLFSVASQLEQAFDWASRRPPA
ncbi:MAG: amidase [Actinomycetota bacterium]